jgi:hypothetical protein
MSWDSPTADFIIKAVEKIRGKKPKGAHVHVEKRRTAWERVLHDEDSTWDKLKRFFSKDKSK